MLTQASRVEDRLPYVIVYVSDLDRAVRFYREGLGLTERIFPVASQMGGVALAIQGTTLVLLDKNDAGRQMPPEAEPGRCYFSFAVSNLEQFHKSAVGRGVECVEPPRQDEFGSFAVYRDPDGLLFSVVQPARKPGTHAVVLSGGVALGAFQLGVLKQIAANPDLRDPDILVGTSVGAFNAAVLAAALPPDAILNDAVARLTAIWRGEIAGGIQDNGVYRLRGDVFRALNPEAMMRSPREILGDLLGDATYLSANFVRRAVNFAYSDQALLSRMVQMIDLSNLLSTEPLHDLVRKHVRYTDLVKSESILKIAATNWKTGTLQLFAHYPVTRQCPPSEGESEITAANAQGSVLASTAIPVVFQPVTVPEVNGTPYVDGGVVMNSPLNPAIDAGADVIHLICQNPDLNTLPVSPLSSSVETIQRLLVAVVAAHVTSDLERARFLNTIAGVVRRKKTSELYRPITIHRYHPEPGNLGGIAGLLDFSLGHIDALIADGVASALNHDCEKAQCVIPHEREYDRKRY